MTIFFHSYPAEDFKKLLPKQAEINDAPWKGPVYWLWVFDPMEDVVHLHHNQGVHRAQAITHSEMSPDVVHPSREEGYAYKIKGGYRITTRKHRPVEDPHVVKKINEALRRANPTKPLPNIS